MLIYPPTPALSQASMLSRHRSTQFCLWIKLPSHQLGSRKTFLAFVWACKIHGAPSIIVAIASTHLKSFHLWNNLGHCLIYIQDCICGIANQSYMIHFPFHNHIHIRSMSSYLNLIRIHSHVLRYNFNHLFTYSKLFNICMVSHQQNRKLQKQFQIPPQKSPKIYIHLVVPVATSYPHIVLIEGVGDSQTLEIGGLGGDLGGFGIANEDVRMFGGGTCGSELWFTAPQARAVLRVLTGFWSPL